MPEVIFTKGKSTVTFDMQGSRWGTPAWDVRGEHHTTVSIAPGYGATPPSIDVMGTLCWSDADGAKCYAHALDAAATILDAMTTGKVR